MFGLAQELHQVVERAANQIQRPVDLVDILQRMELVTDSLSFIGECCCCCLPMYYI